MAVINVEQIGTVRVIRLLGRFGFDTNDVLWIDDVLSSCTKPDIHCLVVNWSGVEAMNSTVLGVILRHESEFLKSGRNYRNCVFSKFMVDLVPLLKMVYDWNYFETEEQAIHACPENPSGGIAESGSPPGAKRRD